MSEVEQLKERIAELEATVSLLENEAISLRIRIQNDEIRMAELRQQIRFPHDDMGTPV